MCNGRLTVYCFTWNNFEYNRKSIFFFYNETVGPEICGTGEPTAHRRCRPHTLRQKVEEGRENRAHTHGTSTSVGRSSPEEMAKLNSLNFI